MPLRQSAVKLDLDAPESNADGTRIPLVPTGIPHRATASRISGGSAPRVSRWPLFLRESGQPFPSGGSGGVPPKFALAYRSPAFRVLPKAEAQGEREEAGSERGRGPKSADAALSLRQVRRVSNQLQRKALSSLKWAITAFNSTDDDGRQTVVLLHLQHAAEMMLKAGLTNQRVAVFDKKSGRSIGFDRCLNLANEHLQIDASDIGVLRTVDSLRDDEQHWLAEVSEELLYLHARATVGVLNKLMETAFGEGLADHLPPRALPITTQPLDDFDVLIDRQYSQIRDLLQTGKRRRPEARSLIRGMLAMEGHAAEDVKVSERDVNRVEKGIRDGKDLSGVFPRLTTVSATTTTDGPSVTVHFAKKKGAPVHFVSADDPADAAAVREVDLQKKFHWSATDLAKKLDLTGPRATALRRHLQIDDDPTCMHHFDFGGMKLIRYSDNALTRMREALDDPATDMAAIWAEHGFGRSGKK